MYPNNGQQGYYQQNGQQQQGYQQQQPGYGQPPQGYPQQMHPQYQQHQQAGMPYGGQGMQPGMPMQPGMMPGMMPGMPYGGQGQQGYAQGRPQMGAGGQMQGTMGMNTGAAVFTPGGSFTPSAPAQSQEPQTPALVKLAPLERHLLRCAWQPPPLFCRLTLPHLAAQTDDEQQWLDQQIDRNAEVAAKAASEKAEKLKQDKAAQNMKDSEPSLEDVPVSPPRPPLPTPSPPAPSPPAHATTCISSHAGTSVLQSEMQSEVSAAVEPEGGYDDVMALIEANRKKNEERRAAQSERNAAIVASFEARGT